MTRKKMNKWAWLAGAALLMVFSLIPGYTAPTVEAQPPTLPHQFYGNVTINGSPAPAGTAVQAYVGGTLNNSTTVDSAGRYGYSTYFTVTGTGGQPVTFYVGGTLAPQTAVYSGGAMTPLNLAISTTTLNVVTNPATGIGSTVATLNGNLSNMGGFGTVNVWFEYGLTTSYGSTTTSQPKATTGTFSAPVSGLSPLTSYYFRAVAQSGTTTVYGSPLTLTTTATGLSVSTSAASGVGTSSATLNGNLNDLGPNSSVSVYFEYGTSMFYGYTTPAQAKTASGSFNAGITSLVAGTTYHYRAVAVGTTTAYGEDTTFTTGIGTLAVETGAATSIGANSATLNGTLISLGGAGSGNVYFQYGTTTSYGSMTTPQSKSSGGAFNKSISGLAASTTYHFRAAAQAGATTVYGSDASFTTSSATGGSSAPPHQFYGKVYLNGVLATSGISVAAYVNGISSASTTTDSSGRYGYTSLFNVTGGPGTVTFYVNSILTSQTATWNSGSITNLNLHAATTGPLTITTTSLPDGTEGVSYSQPVLANGGTTPYIWSISAGTLPAGLSLNSSTGVISGTPTATGPFNFTVQVTDAVSATDTQALSITINAIGVPTITTATLPNGVLSTAYSQTVQATGGTTPYTWSISSGSLPTGLNLNSSTGVISGTPTASGPFNFTVQVTDALSATDTQALSITIDETPGTLNITTTSLPNGALSAAYSQPVLATGGTTPYTWSISSGSLPTGLSLNSSTGVISGTPTASGPFNFTAQVTDAVSATDTQALSITIGVVGDQIIGAPDAPVDNGYQKDSFNLFRFQALKNGPVVTMKVKPYANGNIKMAIYADDSGEPGALLGQTAEAAVTTGGWRSVTISSTAITAGNYYWLAWISSAVVVGENYDLPRVISRHQWSGIINYTDFVFPNPAGTGLLTGIRFATPLIAGY